MTRTADAVNTVTARTRRALAPRTLALAVALVVCVGANVALNLSGRNPAYGVAPGAAALWIAVVLVRGARRR